MAADRCGGCHDSHGRGHGYGATVVARVLAFTELPYFQANWVGNIASLTVRLFPGARWRINEPRARQVGPES